MEQGSSKSITAPGILANDTDQDGNPLTAVLVGEYNGLVFNNNGSFIYTPAASFYGTFTFTYKAFDGTDYSDAATVTITISQKEQPGNNGGDQQPEGGGNPTGGGNETPPADNGGDQNQNPGTEDTGTEVTPPVDQPEEETDETEIEVPDEEIPLGSADVSNEDDKQDNTQSTLPKTGGIPAAVYYGLGALVASTGVVLRKKK